MGKQSKHMKHKCIFLNDMKAFLENEQASKANQTDLHTKAAESAIAAYVSKYDTSKKSPLK